VSALLLSRPDTDTLIREILQRVQSACRRKPVKWLDTASPVEANKRRLMFLDRGDKATQPRQAFAELPEGALILLAPSRRALFFSLFHKIS
jgi:hypothetical protein